MSFVEVVRSEFPLDECDIPEIMEMIHDELEQNHQMMRFSRANNLTESLRHDSEYQSELIKLRKEILNREF